MNTAKMNDWTQNRDEKIDAARTMLADAVGAIQSGDEWRDMLATLARGGRLSLRRLSFRNQMLVMIQRPDASCVATYGAWQKAGRQVRKGERALTILAPVIVSKNTAENADERDSVCVGFRPMATFAGEQTDALAGRHGRPLPESVRITKDVTGEEAFENSVDQLREIALGLGHDVVSAFELRARQPGDCVRAHGWFDRTTKAIVVVTGETSRAQTFKTAVHEVAHALLNGGDEHHARPEMEVEAESVAFVVSSVLGLDTGAYSFPYVAVWAGEENAQAMVLRSGQRIVEAVNAILDALIGDESQPVEHEAA